MEIFIFCCDGNNIIKIRHRRKANRGDLFCYCRLGPEFFSADPRLSALTTDGSSMGLPAIYYRILKLVQDATSSSGVSVGFAGWALIACGRRAIV